MVNLINYIKETKGELKHVSWPNNKQTAFFTILIIIISLVTSAFLGFFDFFFTFLLNVFVL